MFSGGFPLRSLLPFLLLSTLYLSLYTESSLSPPLSSLSPSSPSPSPSPEQLSSIIQVNSIQYAPVINFSLSASELFQANYDRVYQVLTTLDHTPMPSNSQTQRIDIHHHTQTVHSHPTTTTSMTDHDAATTASESYPTLTILPEGAFGMFVGEVSRDILFEYCDYIPDVGDFPLLHTQVYNLSLLAQQFHTTLVVDVCELVSCQRQLDPACPMDEHYQYNSLVVLDVSGVVLAKYRKAHLFGGSPFFDQAKPTPITFTVPGSNYQFGVMICFDMEFTQPIQQLMHLQTIQGIIVSSWWVNTQPTFVAVNFQQAFSYRQQNMSFITSNINLPNRNGGGIYMGGKTLIDSFDPFVDMSTTTILRATLSTANQLTPSLSSLSPLQTTTTLVQEKSTTSTPVKMSLIPCYPNSFFSTALSNCSYISTMDLSQYMKQQQDTAYSLDMTLSHHSLTCSISAMISPLTHLPDTTDSNGFVFLAYQGTQHFDHTPSPLRLQICGFFHCDNASKIKNHYGDEAIVCSNDFTTESLSFSSFTVQASGVFLNYTVFPLFAVNNTAQTYSDPEWLHLDRTLNSDNQLDYTWSSTNSFATTSVYTTALYAVGAVDPDIN